MTQLARHRARQRTHPYARPNHSDQEETLQIQQCRTRYSRWTMSPCLILSQRWVTVLLRLYKQLIRHSIFHFQFSVFFKKNLTEFSFVLTIKFGWNSRRYSAQRLTSEETRVYEGFWFIIHVTTNITIKKSTNFYHKQTFSRHNIIFLFANKDTALHTLHASNNSTLTSIQTCTSSEDKQQGKVEESSGSRISSKTRLCIQQHAQISTHVFFCTH